MTTTIPALGSSLSAQRTEGPVHDTSDAPDFDPAALMSLAHEAGEPAAQRFLDDYLGLLPRRHARILRTLSSVELEDAMDAVLSLKGSSTIVGAAGLSIYCQHLQDQLKSGNFPDLAQTAVELGAGVSAFLQTVMRR